MHIKWEYMEIRRGVRIREIEIQADSIDQGAEMIVARLMPPNSGFTDAERRALRTLLREDASIVKDKVPPSFIKYDVYID